MSTLEAMTSAVRAELDRHGVLLMQDTGATSMVSIVAGEPVKGSWWSHSRSQMMFDVLQVISAESLVVKLISGKRTFVHRRLWPAVCAIGEGRAAWQLDTLRPDARALLERVSADGPLRSDRVAPLPGSRKLSTVVEELEKRLLVHAHDEHTERGHHARVLRTWPSFRAEAGVEDLPAAADACAVIEAAALGYGAAREALPWLASSPRRRR